MFGDFPRGRGRGYCDDFSMSVNASLAYESGEMPLSKWSKKLILQHVHPVVIDRLNLKAVTLDVLKEWALEYVCDHHSSKLYNRTAFYGVREEISAACDADSLASIGWESELRTLASLVGRKTVKKIEESPKRLCRVEFDEWDQRAKKFRHFEAYAVVIGNWALCEGGKRKKVDGSHFTVIETYTRAPRGTAEIFRDLRKLVPSGK